MQVRPVRFKMRIELWILIIREVPFSHCTFRSGGQRALYNALALVIERRRSLVQQAGAGISQRQCIN
jgi:hypothetical protein